MWNTATYDFQMHAFRFCDYYLLEIQNCYSKTNRTTAITLHIVRNYLSLYFVNYKTSEVFLK